MQGGPVKVPVLYPPRETIFEDTPITLTPHRPSETVLYTVDAPHAYKINPFAAETEKGRVSSCPAVSRRLPVRRKRSL